MSRTSSSRNALLSGAASASAGGGGGTSAGAEQATSRRSAKTKAARIIANSSYTGVGATCDDESSEWSDDGVDDGDDDGDDDDYSPFPAATKKPAPKKSKSKSKSKSVPKKSKSVPKKSKSAPKKRTSARVKNLEKKKAILRKRVAKTQAETAAAKRRLESVQAENTDLQRAIDGADGRNDLVKAHHEFAEKLIASLDIDPDDKLAAQLSSGKIKASTGAVYDGKVLPFGEGREFSDAQLTKISYGVKTRGGSGKYTGGRGEGVSRQLMIKATWENGDNKSPLVTKYLLPRAAELIVSENPKLVQLGRLLGLSLIEEGGEVVGIRMAPSEEGET